MLSPAGTFRGLFVTGTDTGVGKTIATGVLAVSLREVGVNAGVMKPVETGVTPRRRSDSEWLMSVAPSDDPCELVAPYRLRASAAPMVAAAAEDLTIDLMCIRSAFEQLASRHDCVLIEGVGGALVPLTPDILVADLIQHLRLPVLIVARSGLGSINHTLLTVECLKSRGIPILGVLFNNAIAPTDNPDIHQTTRTILVKTGLRSFGELPYADGMPATWDRERSRLMAQVDTQGLLEALGFRKVA
ncbi:MAG TPA: dethiobiotin synthase [Nitrospirales bacterium]